jgi:hypothetical protein
VDEFAVGLPATSTHTQTYIQPVQHTMWSVTYSCLSLVDTGLLEEAGSVELDIYTLEFIKIDRQAHKVNMNA